jgi:hypothetical protein
MINYWIGMKKGMMELLLLLCKVWNVIHVEFGTSAL